MQRQSAAAALSYSACSASLLLANKLTVTYFPFSSVIVSIQLAFAIVFIYAMKKAKVIEVDKLEWTKIKSYGVYVASFACCVYSSMRALKAGNVETVVVFRSVVPLLTSFLDYLYLGREAPGCQSLFAFFLIFSGAVGYAAFDQAFLETGMAAYIWVCSYVFHIVFQMTYGKRFNSISFFSCPLFVSLHSRHINST